jgi:hypothetical protein
MSQQNKTTLQSSINSQLADNTSGDISAADIRDNLINVTDSLLFNSGSQGITGSLTATSFTGSLQGTATTASYVVTAQTASYFNGTVISASYSTTASYATTAQTLLGSVTSASYAATASKVSITDTAANTNLLLTLTDGNSLLKDQYNSITYNTANNILNIVAYTNFTGSVSSQNGFTGSLLGTASLSQETIGAGDPSTILLGGEIQFKGSFGPGSTEGKNTFSSAFLFNPISNGLTIGDPNTSYGNGTFFLATGYDSIATGNYSVSHGSSSYANGEGSFTNGKTVTATGSYSHAEGFNTIASGSYSHAEGASTVASGNNSHSEGSSTVASGGNSHAEGSGTSASGINSHAEGFQTKAAAINSHAEGDRTYAGFSSAHAEGSFTSASALYSHTEGERTLAISQAAHAEGFYTTASGNYSHAEGSGSLSSGPYSHAEGEATVALGTGSHAEGLSTIASGSYQHVQGQYNLPSSNTNDLFIIGNGTSNVNRKNILTVSTSSVVVSGSILISGSIIPATNGVSITSSFSLGSPTNAWKDIYVSNGTINFLDGAGNVQGTLGTGTNATVITGSLQVVPINSLTGFTTTNGTLLHKSYTTADCAFAMFDSNLFDINLGIYWNANLNDGKSLVLPWDKKIAAYSLVNNIPVGDFSTSTVVTLPPIYNAGYSTGDKVTIYNLGKADLGYKDTGSIYLVGSMQGVTSVNTSSKQITGTFNQSYVLSGSWGNYTQININNSATTSSIKLNPGQKATFEIVYWGTIYATPSSSMNDFSSDGYQSNFTNVNPSTTYTRYLFKGIENL